jgi:hypothetical protein
MARSIMARSIMARSIMAHPIMAHPVMARPTMARPTMARGPTCLPHAARTSVTGASACEVRRARLQISDARAAAAAARSPDRADHARRMARASRRVGMASAIVRPP